MADIAHAKTDQKLEEMEKRLSAIYSRAEKEIQKTADEYFARFAAQDEKKRKLLEQGKITEEEYTKWRKGNVMYGKRFTEMKEQCAKQLLNVNQTALAYINGELPEVYALNYNALESAVDGVGGYSFTLMDADTVRNLAVTDTSLLPYKEIDPAKDIPWNMKKINAETLQGILQGESMDKIAKRLRNVQEMNKTQAIRSARTIVTGAENKGRQDSYARAEADGIILQKEWVSTNDGRTRHSHAVLDGAIVEQDKKFDNGLMFPGDPNGRPEEVWNCRCTLVAKVNGFKKAQVQKAMAEKQEPQRNPVNGKDLVGDIDYSNSKFDYDIEAALNAQGFDGLPRVVSNEEFEEALKKSNFYAERTYCAPTQEVLDEYRNQLYNGKWYVDCSEGGAQYGQGMYCAARFENGKYIIPNDNKIGWEMSHYQEIGISKGNKFSYTEGITLTPDAKIFTLYEDDTDIINRYAREYALKKASSEDMRSVIREMIDIQEKIDRSSNSNFVGKVDWDFVDKLYDERARIYDTNKYKDEINKLINEGFSKAKANPGALAAEMGYDAINAQGHGESGSYTVILNRTKCIFREGGSRYGN